MESNDLNNITIGDLLNLPVSETLKKTLETISSIQYSLTKLLKSEDSTQHKLMRIGTVFQIFLINTLASGKTPKEIDKEDWKNIAEKVSECAIQEDGQSYTSFVFTLYANYIDLSVKALRAIGIKGDNIQSVADISDELRSLTDSLQYGIIDETDYVEQCLWLSLEAMIKCLSIVSTSLIAPEFAQLTQSLTQLAFEYGRNVLYTKEQAILQEYIDNQYQLDEQLKKEYDAYLAEVNENAERFQALIDAAFSPELHESLQQSVALAKAAGVKEDELLTSMDDIDAFFL